MSVPTDALPNGRDYTLDIHENGGILGVVLQPAREWKINGSIEAAYANRTYTQVSPRALQHYQIHTSYKPKSWATISGAFNDLERAKQCPLCKPSGSQPKRHARRIAHAKRALWIRTELWLSRCILSDYIVLYGDACSLGRGQRAAGNRMRNQHYLGNGYFDAPTQYGAIGITLSPVKKFHAGLGYRMSAVDGTTEMLNPRQVPGSLQSQFQSPYANAAWTFAPGWIGKADWNYYGYGEGTPIGPTLPRSFRGNVYTLGMHYGILRHNQS